MRDRYPDLPVLLTTGYAKQAHEAALEFPILRKPYQLSALALAVRHAFEARRTATAQ